MQYQHSLVNSNGLSTTKYTYFHPSITSSFNRLPFSILEWRYSQITAIPFTSRRCPWLLSVHGSFFALRLFSMFRRAQIAPHQRYPLSWRARNAVDMIMRSYTHPVSVWRVTFWCVSHKTVGRRPVAASLRSWRGTAVWWLLMCSCPSDGWRWLWWF